MSWDLPRDPGLSPLVPLTLPPQSSATQVFDFQMAAAVLRYNQAAPFREAIPAADEWPTLEWTNDNSIRTRAVRIVPRRWFRKNGAAFAAATADEDSVNCTAMEKLDFRMIAFIFT